jgi:hypothetical protein
MSAADLCYDSEIRGNGPLGVCKVGVMAHHILPAAYGSLVSRLNRFPQGAPPSELLYRILAMLLSEKEAELLAMVLSLQSSE